MIELHNADWFIIGGRKDVASFQRPPDEVDNPSDLMGEVVSIDGKQYKVTGVEKFAIATGPGNPYRLPFGLEVVPR